MSLSNDLTISCPKCGDSHKYKLEVQRSYSTSLIIFDGKKPSQTRKFFTRLFTCPDTGKDFQARFWVAEESDAPIKSLEVKGLVTEPADE